MTLPIFRASSLERLLACPASGALPQIDGESSDAAEAGTAGHKYLHLLSRGFSHEDATIEIPMEHRSMCLRIDTTMVDFESPASWETALHYRSDLRGSTGDDPATEHSVTGTADRTRYTSSDRKLIITDWKFGRQEYTTPAKDNIQLRFYALAAMLATNLQIDVVEVELGFIDQETGKVWYDRHTVTSEEITGLMDRIEKALYLRLQAYGRIGHGDGIPNVREGSHCHFCPARSACPAKVDMIKQFASGMVVRFNGEITADKVGKAWVKVQTIKKAISDFEKQVAAWVRDNGDVALPGGKKLGMTKRKGNEVLNPIIGLDELGKVIGVGEATDAVKMTLTKKAILDAVKKDGRTNSDASAIIQRIRDAGGATRKRDSERFGEK